MEKYNAEHEMQRKWLEVANGPKFKEFRSRLKEAESKADCYKRLREDAKNQSEDIIQRLRATEAQLAAATQRIEASELESGARYCRIKELESERDQLKRELAEKDETIGFAHSFISRIEIEADEDSCMGMAFVTNRVSGDSYYDILQRCDAAMQGGAE